MAGMFRRVWALATLALFAGPGVATAACPATSMTRPFAGFGDTASYVLVPGGGFEAATPSWTLTGAAVGTGNEPYYVRAKTDKAALTIEAGGSALSPAFCVDESYATLRFFARRPDKQDGSLKVDVVYKDAAGAARVSTVGEVVSNAGKFAAWAPTPSFNLASALPMKESGGTLGVQLRLTADETGSWAIDDVWADPYLVG